MELLLPRKTRSVWCLVGFPTNKQHSEKSFSIATAATIPYSKFKFMLPMSQKLSLEPLETRQLCVITGNVIAYHQNHKVMKYTLMICLRVKPQLENWSWRKWSALGNIDSSYETVFVKLFKRFQQRWTYSGDAMTPGQTSAMRKKIDSHRKQIFAWNTCSPFSSSVPDCSWTDCSIRKKTFHDFESRLTLFFSSTITTRNVGICCLQSLKPRSTTWNNS